MRAPYLLRDADAIRNRVAQLAADLTDILDSDSVVVGVLKGCLPFMADLIRSIEHEVEVDFLALTAFAPDTGRVRLTRDLTTDVTGRKVVLVEGVVDTGFRLDYLRRHLEARRPCTNTLGALGNVSDSSANGQTARHCLRSCPRICQYHVAPDRNNSSTVSGDVGLGRKGKGTQTSTKRHVPNSSLGLRSVTTSQRDRSRKSV